MKTYLTALNCTELSKIEGAVDFFLESLYKVAQSRNIRLSELSGEISLSVTENQYVSYFNVSLDKEMPSHINWGYNLNKMDGVGEEVLYEIISAKVRAALRIIFDGQILVTSRDRRLAQETIRLGA